MPTRIRTRLALDAERANREQLVRAGTFVRAARHRRRLTQAALGAMVGVSQAALSRLELGHGGGLTLDLWQRIAIALAIPMRLHFQRDPLGETADAGHLSMQELALRLGRAAGYAGTFELGTKSAEPWRSIDVGLIDDLQRRMIVEECWNTFGDVGAAVRVSFRKLAEAREACRGPLGDGNAPCRPRLDRSVDRREPGARRALSRDLQQPIPWVVGGVGPCAHDRLGAAERVRPPLVRCRGDAPVRLATPIASATDGPP